VSCLLVACAACGDPEGRPPRAEGAPASVGLRVVSLHPAATAFVLELGAGGTLIAVDRESARLSGLGPLPTVTLAGAPELRPDLVLVPGLGRDDSAAVARLRALGGEVLEVAPRDYDEVFALCRGLGARLAGAARAAAFESRLGRELGALAAESHGQRRPRVAAVLGLEPLELAPAHSFATDLIELAGGTSTAHDHVQPLRAATLAQLATASPDLVLVVSPQALAEPAREAARTALAGVAPVAFFALDPQRFWVRDGGDAVRRLRALIESHSGPLAAE
jgi:ABC-type hemin transport system substrate-binding protein